MMSPSGGGPTIGKDRGNIVDVSTAQIARGAAPGRRTWLVDRRRQSWTGPRYTRFVEAMKFVLPAVALILMGLLIAYAAVYKTPSEINLGFDGIKFVGEHVEMTKPMLTFVDKQDRTYIVKAVTAIQVPGSTSRWKLNTIDATMTPQNGAPVHLTSRAGDLDTEKQLLDLQGDVLVTTEDGRRFEARSAHVNFANGAVSSEEPVRALSSGGVITSDRFEMEESGNKIRFMGRVHFKTTPKSADTATGG